MVKNFWRHVKVAKNGCLLWTGSKIEGGYGKLHRLVNGESRMFLAHRYHWEQENGPIPEGMQLDHQCRTRACVNLFHLEVVTPRENTLRGTGPTAQNAQKETCVQGHPFTKRNTYWEGTKRKCRTCMKRLRDIQQARFQGPRRPKPSRNALAADIEVYTFVALGEYYGVSDTAVRKWARDYGLR